MSKRVAECRLCGKDRCLEIKSGRMFYCFRMGKTFFLRNGEIYFSGNYSDDKSHFKKDARKDKMGFEFDSEVVRFLDHETKGK